MRRICLLTTGLLVALVVASAAAAQSPQASELVRCENELAADPLGVSGAECLFALYSENSQPESVREQSLELLRAHSRDYPDAPWPHYFLANAVYSVDKEACAEHATLAARSLHQAGVHRGVNAYLNAALCLSQLGRVYEASERLEAAADLVATAPQIDLRWNVTIEHGRLLWRFGTELGSAYRALQQVEVEATDLMERGEDVPARSWQNLMNVLGLLAYDMGLYPEAESYWRRYIAAVRTDGDLFLEAQALYNLAIARKAMHDTHPAAAEMFEGWLREALDKAVEADASRIQQGIHLELGKLLRGEEGLRHLERCVELAEALNDPRRVASCRRVQALVVLEDSPALAHDLINEAVEITGQAEDAWPAMYSSVERLLVRWHTLPRPAAIADGLATLDLVETLRALQATGAGKIGLFAVWSDIYYRLAGLLLGAGSEPPTRADLELAFVVTERMRARMLLETLETADLAPSPSPASDQHEATLEFLRAAASRHVGRIRDAEAQVADEVVADSGGVRPGVDADGRDATAVIEPNDEAYATLPQIERRLSARQALLSFQVGLWNNLYGDFAGGSWLVVATRDGSRQYELPDRAELDPLVPMLVGTLPRRDGSDALPAAHTYGRLLRQALADLPPEIDELILIPDGILHRVPFAALRSTADDAPLALRFEISVVPSATLWLRWQDDRPSAVEPRALVVADPDFQAFRDPAAAGSPLPDDGSTALPPWLRGMPRLPYARTEGDQVLGSLGGVGRLLMNGEATERQFKDARPETFDLIHFAAHAVVDEARPDRSSILLAPGSGEDGFLFVAEIADLDLDGSVVVLSACQSASGQLIRGEGVMSVARAFFEAGAHAVVGNLWPVQDAEAAFFFDAFYDNLAEGMSLSAALRATQRSMIELGMPAQTWAGVVVIGDGSLAPIPRQPRSPAWWGLAAIVAAALLAALMLFRRARTT